LYSGIINVDDEKGGISFFGSSFFSSFFDSSFSSSFFGSS